MREKLGQIIQGVAKSKGTSSGRGDPSRESSYAPYSKAKAKNYAGQSRAKAAARMRRGN